MENAVKNTFVEGLMEQIGDNLKQTIDEFASNSDISGKDVDSRSALSPEMMPVTFTFSKKFNKSVDYLSRSLSQPKTVSSTAGGASNQASRTEYKSWERPEYDLNEITTIVDVEGYVFRGFKKRISHFFKDWVGVDSPSEVHQKYVEKRLRENAFFTGIPTHEFLRSLAWYFVTRSTAIAVKMRKRGLGSGIPRKRTPKGRKINPTVGWFVVDPANVEVQFDEFRNIIKFRIYTPDGGHYADYKPEDVIYMHKERKYGNWCGTPILTSAIQDIQALRQIEENIELYFHQHIFPLYHYRVGTKDQDATVYPGGTTELDVVKTNIQYMPSEGCIVTPFRHDIQPLNDKNKFSGITDVHDIFKKRVFAVLGMSEIDFGESSGSTRATANNLAVQLLHDIKDDMNLFISFFNQEVIQELMLEAPFVYDPFNESHLVTLSFPDPDTEGFLDRIKKVSEAVESNLIDLDYGRSLLGLRPHTEDTWANTYWERVEKPKATIVATKGMTDDIDEGMDNQVKAAVTIEKSKPKPTAPTASKPVAKKPAAKKPVAKKTKTKARSYVDKVSYSLSSSTIIREFLDNHRDLYATNPDLFNKENIGAELYDSHTLVSVYSHIISLSCGSADNEYKIYDKQEVSNIKTNMLDLVEEFINMTTVLSDSIDNRWDVFDSMVTHYLLGLYNSSCLKYAKSGENIHLLVFDVDSIDKYGEKVDVSSMLSKEKLENVIFYTDTSI